MILLGLLLLTATGAFVGLLIADNLSGGPDYTVSVLGNDIATMNSLAVFLSGIALALIFGLGFVLAAGGGTRRRRRAGVPRDDSPSTPTDEGTAPASRPHRMRHLFGH